MPCAQGGFGYWLLAVVANWRIIVLCWSTTTAVQILPLQVFSDSVARAIR